MPIGGIHPRLIMADGTVLENCGCGYSGGKLWCFLEGLTFPEIFQHFSDLSKYETLTLELESLDIIDIYEYTGIEEIITIMQQTDSIDVCLNGQHIVVKQSRRFKPEIPVEEGE